MFFCWTFINFWSIFLFMTSKKSSGSFNISLIHCLKTLYLWVTWSRNFYIIPVLIDSDFFASLLYYKYESFLQFLHFSHLINLKFGFENDIKIIQKLLCSFKLKSQWFCHNFLKKLNFYLWHIFKFKYADLPVELLDSSVDVSLFFYW